MTGVETIARIRFEHFQNCKGIKRIARELGIARDTVRKVLRSGATEFSYKREVQPQRKLGLWVEALTQILESEDKLPRRERRSTIRLFEELRGRGYDGAHDSVHRFVKAWRADRARTPAQAFIPLRFDPGEAYQFDWSREGIELQSLPLTVKLAQMRLSYSRMPIVRAYPRETQEMVFDAHDKAFAFYGALRNGAPFKDWDLPAPLSSVRAKLQHHVDGDRQFVKILARVPEDGIAAVAGACAEALEAGIANGDVVMAILARKRQPPIPPSITTPDALKLKAEPIADCARYDNLRKGKEAA